MALQFKAEARWTWPENEPLDGGRTALLNHLRFVALGCRSKARGDLFRACALLQVDKSGSMNAHAEALILCLNEALGKRATLFRPGVSEHSFDEAWLLQLATSIARGDERSIRFLLHSRVAADHRRHIRYLVARVSERFPLN